MGLRYSDINFRLEIIFIMKQKKRSEVAQSSLRFLFCSKYLYPFHFDGALLLKKYKWKVSFIFAV